MITAEAMQPQTYSEQTTGVKNPDVDLVNEVRERIVRAYNADKHNRDEAAADMRFLAGDQWPEYARQARVNRPMLTINKLPQFLHQVTNDIRQNAPTIKVTPVDGKNDPNLAKVYDGLISDIQYRWSAKHVYATAAYHAAACGIGNFRIGTKYMDDDGFDQEITLELIPYPLAVYWDPAAVKPDRSDAMWCIVIDMMPRDTFKEKYPDAIPNSVDAIHSNGSLGGLSSGLFWTTRDHVLVAEYWCKKPYKKTIAAFQSGATFDITGADMMKLYQLQSQYGPMVRKRQANSFKVYQTIVSGSEVLSPQVDWPGRYIPIISVIGSEVPLETQTIRSGLIRNARDAQQLYNFNRSAAAEHIALSPKSPYFVTDKMIENHMADWNSLNTKNRPFVRIKPDPAMPGAVPIRINAPEPPQALWNEAQLATEDIKATTGIYDASLGARSNETSGVAIKRREEQGSTATFHYPDNLQRSIEQCGRVIIDLIPHVYDNERQARLLAEDGSENFVPINKVIYAEDGQPVMVNDLSQGRFDVRVTIGPSFATKRLEAADAMLELMKVLPPEQAALLSDIAVRNLDVPEAQEAAKRLKSVMPPQALLDPDAPPPPPPNPLDDPVVRAEVEGKTAKAKKDHADAHRIMLETLQMFQTPAMPQSIPLPLAEEQMGGTGAPMPVMPPPMPEPMPGEGSPRNQF